MKLLLQKPVSFFMPIPLKYLADFNENGIYHVYNRTNNREKLFLTDENRHFFLRKYHEYLSPFLDTYCWSLLPNHFHLLVKVKPIAVIRAGLKATDFSKLSLTEKNFLNNEALLSNLVEQSFKRFFQSYSLSFNKVHKRKGNLFYKPFKRIEVNKDSHFSQCIIYIHANPLKHEVAKDFTAYKWSSWQAFLSDSPTHILRAEVLEWFGNKERFIQTHKEMTQYYYESEVSIED
jgi:putative transposase